MSVILSPLVLGCGAGDDRLRRSPRRRSAGVRLWAPEAKALSLAGGLSTQSWPRRCEGRMIGGVATPGPYGRLFEPLAIRGHRLRNRIVSSAHNPNGDVDGVISEKHVRYHVRKARGGAGLIMTFGSASVHREAGAFPDSIRLWDPDKEPALRALARGMHDHGGVVMSQASHLGHRGSSLGCIGRDYQGLPMLCTVNRAVA